MVSMIHVDQKKFELIDQFNKRIAQLTIDPTVSAEQAAEQAFAEIDSALGKKYLGADSAKLFEGGAYRELANQNRTAAGNAEVFGAKISYVNSMLSAYADDLSVVLDKPYLMSDAELELLLKVMVSLVGHHLLLPNMYLKH